MSNDKTETKPTSKIWAFLKKWGLTGAIGTIVVGAGTWIFTTIDNLKDQNIELRTKMENYEVVREAQWRRLYHFNDIQIKNTIEIQTSKRLYNIIVYSKKINEKSLPKHTIDKVEVHKSMSFEDFKKHSMMPPQQQQQQAPK